MPRSSGISAVAWNGRRGTHSPTRRVAQPARSCDHAWPGWGNAVLNKSTVKAFRIGYLVPEFPGQTHIMFRREFQALAALGVEGKIISSRRPNRKLMSHSWSAEAARVTEYLHPLLAG